MATDCLETYTVNKGICYIFANFVPGDPEEKKGKHIKCYLKDIENIRKLFKTELRFKLREKLNLTKKEFLQEIQNIEKDLKGEYYDQLLVFILSHGIQNGLLMCSENTEGAKVEKKDNGEPEYVPEEDIMQIFSHSKIPSMKGQPRCIFINACRGNKFTEECSGEEEVGTNLEDVSLDLIDEDISTTKITKVPSQADMLIFFSSLPGETSTAGDKGSNFLNSVIHKMKQMYTDYSMVDILVAVNSELKDKPPQSRYFPCNFQMVENMKLQVDENDDNQYKDCSVQSYLGNKDLGTVFYKPTKGRKYLKYVVKSHKYTIEVDEKKCKDKEYHVSYKVIFERTKQDLGITEDQTLQDFEECYGQVNTLFDFKWFYLYGNDEHNHPRPYGCGPPEFNDKGMLASTSESVVLDDGKSEHTLVCGDRKVSWQTGRKAKIVKKDDELTMHEGVIEKCEKEKKEKFLFLQVSVKQMPVFHCTLTKRYFLNKCELPKQHGQPAEEMLKDCPLIDQPGNNQKHNTTVKSIPKRSEGLNKGIPEDSQTPNPCVEGISAVQHLDHSEPLSKKLNDLKVEEADTAYETSHLE